MFDIFTTSELYINIAHSLQRVITGFSLAIFLAVPSAYFASQSKIFGYVIKTVVELLRPIPPIALIPVAIVLFGIGNSSAYAIVAFGTFFPVFSGSFFGFSSLPRMYYNVSMTFELSPYVYFMKVRFPFALPHILGGLKVGMGMAWMSVIAAELVGAQSGLGYYIQINRLLLRTDKMFIGIAVIGFIGLALNVLIGMFEKKLVRWRT